MTEIVLSGSVSNNKFPDKTRPNYSVDYTVTATGTDARIVSVVTEPFAGLNIVNGVNTSRITGDIADPFEDILHYTDEGRAYNPNYKDSDIYQDPQIHKGINGFPKGKNLFKVEQDQRNSLSYSTNITVKYVEIDPLTSTESSEKTQTFAVTQTLINERNSITEFLKNYYKE